MKLSEINLCPLNISAHLGISQGCFVCAVFLFFFSCFILCFLHWPYKLNTCMYIQLLSWLVRPHKSYNWIRLIYTRQIYKITHEIWRGDFRLPLGCKWDPHSSRMLSNVEWYLVTEVSGQQTILSCVKSRKKLYIKYTFSLLVHNNHEF